jgi:N-acetylneuraminate synthase
VKDIVIHIDGREIGGDHACLVIAEAGANHNGDLSRAHDLIDAAAAAGADAVKFQSFVTEELVTRSALKAAYQQETTSGSQAQFEMLKTLEIAPAQQRELMAHCRECGVVFLSTPYDWPSADALDALGISAFKVASTDTTNVPFLEFLAAKGRPILLSTGMCDLGEVEAAVRACRAGGPAPLVLLHCTSEYPAPVAESNLRAMETLRRAFACPVGFSDHTPGIGVAPWAVAVGACVLEKHFTLDRTLPGPDHRASLEPAELAELVRTVRAVEAALGDGVKRPVPSELRNKPVMQKSIVARRDIAAGEVLAADALTCKRPATGLPPAYWSRVVGRRAARAIGADEPLTLGAVAWE